MKKQNPWFRLYAEVLEDPKVQRLNGEAFKGWVNLLCLACKRGGRISQDEIAFSLRLPDKKAEELLKTLRERGLIEFEEKFVIPHNWNGRQFQSDDATERSRKFRERKKKELGNVPSTNDATLHATIPDRSSQQLENVPATADATPPDTDTDTDTDTEKRLKAYVEIREKPDFDLPALWKAHCGSLPQIRELTKKRKDKIKARLKEHPEESWWIQVFSLIEASDFCKGNSSTGWKATFDWIIDNSDNAVKVLEGKYSNTGGSNVAPTGGNGSRPKTFREIDAENDARNRRNYLIASGLLPPDGSFVDAGLPSLPHPRQENA